MFSINNLVILKGRITADVQITAATNGRSWTMFSIAVDDSYIDKSTEKRVEKTSFIDVRAWAKIAEFVGRHCKKGDMIEVSGKLVVDAWEDKGTGQKRRKLVVEASTVANLMWFGQPKKGGPQHEPNAYNGTQTPKSAPAPFGAPADFDDGDIPF